MADIPYGTYNVSLHKPANNWANGALVYNANGTSYKGQPVTNFNPSTTNVGWDVTLSHGGTDNCPLSFTGGHYSDATGHGKITLGTVSGGCLAARTPDSGGDNWSADATTMGGEHKAKTHHSHR